ncbi:MAG TPA: alpha/beta hydrolase-fold protein [Pyrinomonadaceae bacterium]|nr:alpha/beta hydrolase-fold protein [Pyrinomonadaceae bacterium]
MRILTATSGATINYCLFPRSILAAALFILGLHTAGAPARSQSISVTPDRLVLKSRVLGDERVVFVRTPPEYKKSSNDYPVLYLLDGDVHFLHTAGTIEFLARNMRMPEMIVVGIPHVDRNHDLTPTRGSIPRMEGKTEFFPTSGGGPGFLKFIEDELIPFIEVHYRTESLRILAGHSFGGLFAVYTLLTRPALFDGYIAVSPSLQWDNQVLLKQAKEVFSQGRRGHNRLYLALGNEPGPILPAFDLFIKLLADHKPNGLVWQTLRLPEEDHGSVVLRSHYSALKWHFADWQRNRKSRKTQ